MKKIILASFLFVLSSSVFAWTIGPMNYQGRLLNNSGIPLTGSYNFTVRIYDAASGGTLKYSELQNSIAVDDGVYSFLVSTGTSPTGNWDINLWNTPTLYMEIAVNGQTLTPRQLLASAPFAYQANLALTTNNALALGGKTAAQYDSTLAAICVSGKGRWLEKVGKCLGVGSSFPGHAETGWWTLTDDNTFSDIDLSRADISGIDFTNGGGAGGSYSVIFQNVVFNQTIYSVRSFKDNVDLKNTRWDGASAVDSTAVVLDGSVTLQDAIFKNMDMSVWNLSGISLNNVGGLSAALLSNCPAGLPASWECRDDAVPQHGEPGLSFLLGPGANLSANSAAAVSKYGVSYLDLGVDVLNNIDLSGAVFDGNVITQNFINTMLMDVHFNYTTLKGNIFDNCNLTRTRFESSKLIKPVFRPTNVFDRPSFKGAELNFVRFQSSVDRASFYNATLTTVDFVAGVNWSDFTYALLDEVSITGNTGDNVFSDTRFYHGFQHGTAPSPTNSYTGGSTFNNLTFIGGTLKGDFTGATFTGAMTFSGVMSSGGLDVCGATFPLVNGVVPGWSIGLGPECPDGNDYAPCNSSPHMIPIAVGQCTPGVQ